MSEFSHIPVMLNEVIDGLQIKPNGIYVDCTLGGAGHSLEICKRLDGGKLIGIDKDRVALKASEERLKGYNVELIHGDFKEIIPTLPLVDGILMDLGVSSYQLDTPERGFSYRFDSELDMRMDTDKELTAKIVVNSLSEEKLSKIFFDYGEERFSRQIARAIVEKRKTKEINSTGELCEIIINAIPPKARYSGSNPYMRVFQALRIYVNGELDGLEKSVSDAVDRLKPFGRICIITFHSLEDRAVKNKFKYLESDCVCPPQFPICRCDKVSTLSIVTKKPITASVEELKINRRAECAKLRIGEKKLAVIK